MSAASALATGGFAEQFGEGWPQLAQLGVALVLSAAVGLERELRLKAAGLRTYTTVGVGAALFVMVSKYGFSDVLSPGRVEVDPSRVAAQIVSGLGFIGAGVIFVHRGSIQGLTTAATVWLTAAIGTAVAAGLPLLAVLATAAYFVVSYLVRPLVGLVPALRESGMVYSRVVYVITYRQGQGLLRDLLDRLIRAGFTVNEVRTLTDDGDDGPDGPRIELRIGAHGRGDADGLAAELVQMPGVLACHRIDVLDD